MLQYQFFLTKPFASGILLLTAVTFDFVAKLVIQGFDSAYFRIKVKSIQFITNIRNF